MLRHVAEQPVHLIHDEHHRGAVGQLGQGLEASFQAIGEQLGWLLSPQAQGFGRGAGQGLLQCGAKCRPALVHGGLDIDGHGHQLGLTPYQQLETAHQRSLAHA